MCSVLDCELKSQNSCHNSFIKLLCDLGQGTQTFWTWVLVYKIKEVALWPPKSFLVINSSRILIYSSNKII